MVNDHWSWDVNGSWPFGRPFGDPTDLTLTSHDTPPPSTHTHHMDNMLQDKMSSKISPLDENVSKIKSFTNLKSMT